MSTAKGTPILISCEGSGGPVHGTSLLFGTCRMCGRFVAATDGNAHGHERDDIIARIERGDFG